MQIKQWTRTTHEAIKQNNGWKKQHYNTRKGHGTDKTKYCNTAIEKQIKNMELDPQKQSIHIGGSSTYRPNMEELWKKDDSKIKIEMQSQLQPINTNGIRHNNEQRR